MRIVRIESEAALNERKERKKKEKLIDVINSVVKNEK